MGGTRAMIIGFVRLAVFGFLGLSVFYVLLSLYMRSVEKERLEKEFDAGGVAGARDDHITQGMEIYRKSLRVKLLWLVYVIPMVVAAALIYILNFQ
jgi:Ca2+/Na+ antiporter